AEEDETEEIAQKLGHERPQRLDRRLVRRMQLQHHDGDDDRQHAVAKRFQPALTHASPPRSLIYLRPVNSFTTRSSNTRRSAGSFSCSSAKRLAFSAPPAT